MFHFDSNESFPEREVRILEGWKRGRVFQRSVEERKGGKLFSFYDGPPFATGLPHYGHLLAGTIKDVVPRYWTMKGLYVPRRFGWDCHGLPVENEIEKAKELSGASAIEAFGIRKFNEECRAIVMRYASEWKRTVERMARWVDMDNDFKTMDVSFMESVWWVFKQLVEKGLVYEGYKVMPFSTKLGTPLSNFEANLNYKDVDDPSLTVMFQSVEEPGVCYLAWTTTPWTLPSNLALVVGPELVYVKVRDGKKRVFILAESRLKYVFKEEVEVLERMTGRQLEGKGYKPLFPFFADRKEAFRVIVDESVSTEEGTGIVHTAPAFGEVDFYICKREGIDPVCPVDANGHFTLEVPPYAGTLVKDADREIMRDLKVQGAVFHQGTIRHRYPFCWRSDTPLIYKAVSTWFVAVEKIKDQILAANQKIHWVPGHIKEGRFGKWLENARDWAISRNRYWGTPIPMWRSEAGDCIAVGSIAELEKLTGHQVTDLHRHHIDELVIRKEGQVYRRVSEVFDCWFESGSMPYAQGHYPFKGKEAFEKNFPADFIAEGLDQTRGWFYTLTVLAAALFDKPAFQNVIVNGIILAEDGNKMSKRLKNYPDPDVVIQKYGADAIRLYMLQSPAVLADDLRFSERGVEQILRSTLIPMWNSFVFLSTYAKIEKWEPKQGKRSTALIDRWILSRSQKLIADVERGLQAYQLTDAVEPIVGFIDQLTNWYIRRSRSRFWSGDQDAFATLREVLLTLAKVTAPFVPYISDAIYQELKTPDMPDSVHLALYPEVDSRMRDEALEKEVEAAQAAVSLGHRVRKDGKLKVRQPLARAHVISADKELLQAFKQQKTLIADELNVKEVVFSEDESAFVSLRATPHFPTLGKKIGKLMPLAKEAVGKLERAALQKLLAGHAVLLQVGPETIQLEPADVQIVREVRAGLAAGNEGSLTVALDTALTEDLLLEGFARELVNRINTMRKEMGFEITDRIQLHIQGTPRVEEAYKRHAEYISGEVLALDVTFGPCDGVPCDLNGEEIQISLRK